MESTVKIELIKNGSNTFEIIGEFTECIAMMLVGMERHPVFAQFITTCAEAHESLRKKKEDIKTSKRKLKMSEKTTGLDPKLKIILGLQMPEIEIIGDRGNIQALISTLFHFQPDLMSVFKEAIEAVESLGHKAPIEREK